MLKLLIYLSIVFLVLQQVIAEQQPITIEVMKESYSPGETVQIKIITEPLEKPLKADQLALYVDGVKKPIAPFFTRYSDTIYLLYFDLPLLVPGIVQFKVEKILYKGTGVLEEITAEQEIPITSEPDSILSIIPAFVVLEKNQREFQIQVENKHGGMTFNITASPSIAHLYTTLQTISLNGKRIFKFNVDLNKLEQDAAVQINHEGTLYRISVLKRQQIIEPQQNETLPEAKNLVFLAAKPEVRKSITTDVSLSGILSLKNEGNITLENIQVRAVGAIEQIATIDTTLIPMLGGGQSRDILLKINEQQTAPPGIYEGVLQAEAGAIKTVFPIFIEIKELGRDQPENKTNIDLNLKRPGPEPPDDDNTFDVNFSKPKPQQTTKEYPLGLILITMIILIGAAGFYFLKKKKVVKEETFDDYIKKIRK